jgi:hypothetical protein
LNRLGPLLTIGAFVLGTSMAIACADESTSPSNNVAFSRSPSLMPLGFTRCEPQPYASSSARIGPNGGTLRAGKHMLRIPAGALKRPALITMESPSDSLNYVVFSPEGLTFDEATPPILVMSYRNCTAAEYHNQPFEIIYVNDSLSAVLETTEAIPADTLNKTVGAKLRHFSKYVLRSRYAVAY